MHQESIFKRIGGRFVVVDECVKLEMVEVLSKLGVPAIHVSKICGGAPDSQVIDLVKDPTKMVLITSDNALAGSVSNAILIPKRPKRPKKHARRARKRIKEQVRLGMILLNNPVTLLEFPKNSYWSTGSCPICSKQGKRLSQKEMAHVRRHEMRQALGDASGSRDGGQGSA